MIQISGLLATYYFYGAIICILVSVITFVYLHYYNNDPTRGMSEMEKERYDRLKTCYFCKKTFRRVLNTEIISHDINRPVCDTCYRTIYDRFVPCDVCNKSFRFYQTKEWVRDRMFLPVDDGTMRLIQQNVGMTVHICERCEQIDFEYVVLQFLKHLTPRQQEVVYAILVKKLTKDDIAILVSTLKQERNDE